MNTDTTDPPPEQQPEKQAPPDQHALLAYQTMEDAQAAVCDLLQANAKPLFEAVCHLVAMGRERRRENLAATLALWRRAKVRNRQQIQDLAQRMILSAAALLLASRSTLTQVQEGAGP
jgi:hypothetical protein